MDLRPQNELLLQKNSLHLKIQPRNHQNNHQRDHLSKEKSMTGGLDSPTANHLVLPQEQEILFLLSSNNPHFSTNHRTQTKKQVIVRRCPFLPNNNNNNIIIITIKLLPSKESQFLSFHKENPQRRILKHQHHFLHHPV